MPKILIPVDDTPQSERAVEHALAQVRDGAALDIHLLNVQIPIDSGHARMFFSRDDVAAYHREEGVKALVRARRLLDDAGVPYSHHIAVGHVADTIIRYAREKGFDQIVMAPHRVGGLLALGSVTQDVVKHSTVPVILVGPPNRAESVPTPGPR
jgi:nucleotide-binding universal stress UspA family protein